jgi:4'-phosphopantetheinyl transferase
VNSPCTWLSPATHPELRATEAHLWFADLLQPAEVIRALGGMLSADEQSRADRFYFERDRRRYIVSRGLLRQILSRYLALDGHDLVFRYGEWGKPALGDYENTRDMQFNLSHAADRVVCVLATNRRVGIDVESIRPIPEADDIVDRFLPPENSRNYHSLNASRREEAFFWHWTRREALFKALGHGLTGAEPASGAPGSDVRPHQPSDGHDGQAACTWFLHSFSPTQDSIGAVAVEGNLCDLKYYHANPGNLLVA